MPVVIQQFRKLIKDSEPFSLQTIILGIALFLGFIPHGHKKAPAAPGILPHTITSKDMKKDSFSKYFFLIP